jgi:hypothetical protein
MPPTARSRASIPTSLLSKMRHSNICRAFFVSVIMASTGLSSSAFAQGGTGRFVSGPLEWTPSFQLREAGVDSNVFNSSRDPKQDVSGSALSQVNSVLTLGVLQASTQGSLEYAYFERFKTERGFNRRVNSHVEFPVTRLSPDITVTWAKVKERSGNEIDTRAPRTDWGYAAGIQTRITSRAAVTATIGKQKVTYEPGFSFHGVDIGRQLDRESLLANVSTRVTVTPLTNFFFDAGVGRDEFPFKPDAATDNLRLVAGFDFAPDAIVRGSAAIGYHSMQPHHRGVTSSTAAAFNGITSSVNLGYTLLGVTRFAGRFSRDSNYSINTSQPLYLSTAGGLDILQTLFGPVDLSIRGSRERLTYPETDLAASHIDYADTLAGGISIRVAPDTVVALMYDNSERRSTAGREFEYERRRIYTTITYGF